MTLTTKLQFKKFEPGEFTDEKDRTYEETIRLIEQFPWNEQRVHQPVGPTNASVTIQGDNNNFLKLTLYYNDKFILYYLDEANNLYARILEHFEDSYGFVQAFFSSPLSFDTTDFKQEHSWTHGNAIHFQDRDFRYTVNKSWWKWQIGLIVGFFFAEVVLFVSLSIFIPGAIGGKIFIAIPILFTALIAPPFFKAAIKNFKASCNNVLVLATGNDVFYYGPKDQPEKFDKKDIRELTVYGTLFRRSKLTGFTKIGFKQSPDRAIYIPDYILDYTDLQLKIPGITVTYNTPHSTSFIPSYATIPS